LVDECFCVCCKAQPSSGSHLFRAAAYGGKCRRVDIHTYFTHVRDTSTDRFFETPVGFESPAGCQRRVSGAKNVFVTTIFRLDQLRNVSGYHCLHGVSGSVVTQACIFPIIQTSLVCARRVFPVRVPIRTSLSPTVLQETITVPRLALNPSEVCIVCYTVTRDALVS
jgi:hypothetical protein